MFIVQDRVMHNFLNNCLPPISVLAQEASCSNNPLITIPRMGNLEPLELDLPVGGLPVA